jgi:hypothetical protein
MFSGPAAPDARRLPSSTKLMLSRIIFIVRAFNNRFNEVIVSRLIHPTENLHGDRPSAASEQGLADAKEFTAAAFQRTRMPMVLAVARAADFPIVLANEAFLKLTGYAAEEVIGTN